MHVTGYVLASSERVARRVCGRESCLFTSPPHTLENPPPWEKFEHAGLIYLRLHGLPDQPYAYGDGLITALSADQVSSLDLSSVRLAILGNCHQALASAFRLAGCPVVVHGDGVNYGSRWPWLLAGVDLLTREAFGAIRAGMDVHTALIRGMQKVRDRLSFHERIPVHGRSLVRADLDVLNFRVSADAKYELGDKRGGLL